MHPIYRCRSPSWGYRHSIGWMESCKLGQNIPPVQRRCLDIAKSMEGIKLSFSSPRTQGEYHRKRSTTIGSKTKKLDPKPKKRRKKLKKGSSCTTTYHWAATIFVLNRQLDKTFQETTMEIARRKGKFFLFRSVSENFRTMLWWCMLDCLSLVSWLVRRW